MCSVNADPRAVMREAFLGHLGDAEKAEKIEGSCYNTAIQIARKSPTMVLRNWQNATFADIYSSRCGAVLTHLQEGHRGPRTCESGLLGRIAAGAVDLAAIGALSERDLCLDTLKAEKAEVQRRLDQKVVIKYSTMFRCPKCKSKDKIIATEKQVRALDEGRSTFCECQACGEKFRAS